MMREEKKIGNSGKEANFLICFGKPKQPNKLPHLLDIWFSRRIQMGYMFRDMFGYWGEVTSKES